MNNLARFFEQIGDNLLLIELELDIRLTDVRIVEIVPGVPDAYGVVKDWIMHINDEQFAHVQRNHLGRLEIRFQAYYSDFDYLFQLQEQTA